MIIWKNADIGCDSVKIGIIGGGAVGLYVLTTYRPAIR